jgi:hypothetical protein
MAGTKAATTARPIVLANLRFLEVVMASLPFVDNLVGKD